MKTPVLLLRSARRCSSYALVVILLFFVSTILDAQTVTITVQSDGSTQAAALPLNDPRIFSGNTTGLTFVPVDVGAFGTFTPVPPGAPAATQVINIPPDDGESGLFRVTFTLPSTFTNIQLMGSANVDDIGFAFLNGNPISPELTEFGDVIFSTANSQFFNPGLNELVISDDNVGFGPSGGAFFALITYETNSCQLSVTRFSQGNPLWARDHYDHKLWVSPATTTTTPTWLVSATQLQLVTETQSFPITLSAKQDDLPALAKAINGLNAGVHASVKTIPPTNGSPALFQLQISDTVGGACSICGDDANGLQLQTLPGRTNVLTPVTIQKRGCYLSSLAMAVNFLAPFSDPAVPTEPDFLNDYMILTPGAYSTTGNVQPGKTIGQIAADFSVGLAWNEQRIRSTTKSLTSSASEFLDNALCTLKVPVIVGVNMDANHVPIAMNNKGDAHHFVVVTGKQLDASGNTQYSIADPGFASRQLLSAYPEFVTRGFVSDPVPQSALYISVEDPADLMVEDPLGNQTGFDMVSDLIVQGIPGSAYFGDAIDDDVESDVENTVNHSVGIPQPANGNYKLSLNGVGLGVYTLQVSAFLPDGTPQAPVFVNGVAAPGSVTNFVLQFSSVPSPPLQVKRTATFQSTLADIDNSLQAGLIDDSGIANSLSQKILAAQAASGVARNNILHAFNDEVSAQSGKHVTGIVVQMLFDDSGFLMSQNSQ